MNINAVIGLKVNDSFDGLVVLFEKKIGNYFETETITGFVLTTWILRVSPSTKKIFEPSRSTTQDWATTPLWMVSWMA